MEQNKRKQLLIEFAASQVSWVVNFVVIKVRIVKWSQKRGSQLYDLDINNKDSLAILSMDTRE